MLWQQTGRSLVLGSGVRVSERGTDKHPPVVCFGRDGQDHHGYSVYQCTELNPEGPTAATPQGREKEREKERRKRKENKETWAEYTYIQVNGGLRQWKE